MSGTYSGTYNSAVTLSATAPSVTIDIGATIAAGDLLGNYGVGFAGSESSEPFYGALLGPAGAFFTVTNQGVIQAMGSHAYTTGILLGDVGEVINAGHHTRRAEWWRVPR